MLFFVQLAISAQSEKEVAVFRVKPPAQRRTEGRLFFGGKIYPLKFPTCGISNSFERRASRQRMLPKGLLTFESNSREMFQQGQHTEDCGCRPRWTRMWQCHLRGAGFRSMKDTRLRCHRVLHHGSTGILWWWWSQCPLNEVLRGHWMKLWRWTLSYNGETWNLKKTIGCV